MDSKVTPKFLAEFIGTFAIVFFGAGSVCVNSQFPGSLGLVGISLTFGMVVAVMVSATGHISGAHFNPAVTVMCLVTRRIPTRLAGIYASAQLAGAASAALLLRYAFTPEAWSKVNLGATGLTATLPPVLGALIEAILTFFLVVVIFGTAIDQRGHRLGGIAIGGIVCVDILVGGPLTGASMNPARSFGPALASGYWTNHWVYWIGPMLGAVGGAWAYERVMAPRPSAQGDPQPRPVARLEKAPEEAGA
jgi:MIP family channel proteins